MIELPQISYLYIKWQIRFCDENKYQALMMCSFVNKVPKLIMLFL